MCVTWKDGRLAAKQLFDALRACGVDPAKQGYDNWFRSILDRWVRKATIVAKVRRALADGVVVVALGARVSGEMEAHGLSHLKLVHPAARGRIRKKERYAEHVRTTLADVT